MPTTTTNYGFSKPLVNNAVDEDLWGTQLNANLDTLDTLLGARTASKYGALIVQNSSDNGFDTITSQGTSGTDVLISNGADALPSFQSIKAVIGALLMPVGTVYVNYSDSTSPATLFGFGTWVALTDRFLIGASGTYAAGSTGGATTHTLTANEIPPLTYSIKLFGSAAGGTANIGECSSTDSTNDTATDAITTNAGGAAHSILNPYTAVYMWRRTV